MPQVPVETFVSACQEVVKANLAYLPPYGTGGTLYLRPYMIGVGDNIGVAPAKEYIFSIFCVPVGSYFKNDVTPPIQLYSFLNMIEQRVEELGPLKWGAIMQLVFYQVQKHMRKNLVIAFI